MQPRVFISHSCKDSDTDPSEAVAYARKVRALVEDKLEAAGFEVWLDQTGLEPGAVWRAKLHRWLGTCDAAVILLDEESVLSPWLLKEATILAWRRDIGSSVRVVPALLGGFAPDAIAGSPLSAIELDASQFARIDAADRSDASAEALAQRVVAGLHGLERGEPQTDMDRWVMAVRGLLDQVHPRAPYLTDAAERLGLAADDWIEDEPGGGLTATLAHHMLHLPLDDVLDALEALYDGVPEGKFGLLVDLIRPVWVEPEAGQCLSAFVNDPTRIVVLGADKVATAADYLRRARFCQIRPQRIYSPQLPTGMNPGLEARAGFLEAMSREWGKPWPAERDTVAGMLGDTRVQRYVVLGPAPLPATIVQELNETYGMVRFVVLRSSEHAEAFAAGIDGRLVRPGLAAGAEVDAHSKLSGIEELI